MPTALGELVPRGTSSRPRRALPSAPSTPLLVPSNFFGSAALVLRSVPKGLASMHGPRALAHLHSVLLLAAGVGLSRSGSRHGEQQNAHKAVRPHCAGTPVEHARSDGPALGAARQSCAAYATQQSTSCSSIPATDAFRRNTRLGILSSQPRIGNMPIKRMPADAPALRHDPGCPSYTACSNAELRRSNDQIPIKTA